MNDDLPDAISLQDDGADMVAHLTGEIDQSNAPEILEHLRKVGKERTLTLDLTQTRYFDSAAISMVEQLRHLTDLRLRVSQGSIADRVLSISGLDKIIPTDSEQ
jgi:anti-anti-sigma factor